MLPEEGTTAGGKASCRPWSAERQPLRKRGASDSMHMENGFLPAKDREISEFT